MAKFKDSLDPFQLSKRHNKWTKYWTGIRCLDEIKAEQA